MSSVLLLSTVDFSDWSKSRYTSGKFVYEEQAVAWGYTDRSAQGSR